MAYFRSDIDIIGFFLLGGMKMSGSAGLFNKKKKIFYLVGSPKVGGAGDGKHKKIYGHPNVSTGESSGPAAAGHDRSPYRAQAQDADSGLQTDSGLRTPEEENSVMPKYERPYDRIVIEGLCSLTDQLEKTVVRLQQDIADYRAELKISETHTPAVSVRDGDSVQTTMKAPTPTQEVNAVEKMQQRLVTDTRSPTELCSFIAGQRRTKATATATATRPAGLERCVMFLLREVGSCSSTMPEFE